MLLSRGSFALSSMGRESRFPDRGRKPFSSSIRTTIDSVEKVDSPIGDENWNEVDV